MSETVDLRLTNIVLPATGKAELYPQMFDAGLAGQLEAERSELTGRIFRTLSFSPHSPQTFEHALESLEDAKDHLLATRRVFNDLAGLVLANGYEISTIVAGQKNKPFGPHSDGVDPCMTFLVVSSGWIDYQYNGFMPWRGGVAGSNKARAVAGDVLCLNNTALRVHNRPRHAAKQAQGWRVLFDFQTPKPIPTGY